MKQNKGRYFWKLFLFGLAFLLIPVFALLLYFSISSNQYYQEQLIQSHVGTVRQVKERIDSELDSIHKATISAVSDQEILQAIYQKDLGSNQETIMRLFQKMSILSQVIKEGYSVELYVPGQNVLISSANGIFTERNMPNETAALYQPVEALRKPLWGFNRQPSNVEVISYFQPLPLVTNFPQGYLTVHVHEQAFYKILHSVQNQVNGKLLIVNSSGKFISGEDKSLLGTYVDKQLEKQIKLIQESTNSSGYIMDDSQAEVIFYGKSLSSDLITIFIIPYSAIQRPDMINGFLWLFIVVGIFMVYLVSKILYRPLQHLHAKLPASLHDGFNSFQTNEWKLFESRYSQLEQNVIKLEQSQAKTEQQLRELFLLQVISSHENVITDTEWQNISDFYQLDLDARVQVVLIQPRQLDESNPKYMDQRLLLFSIINIGREIAEQYNLIGHFIEQQTAGRVILIVPYSSSVDVNQTESMLDQLLDNIQHIVFSYFKRKVMIGIGGSYPVRPGLIQSYQDSLRLLAYAQMHQTAQLVRLDDVDTDQSFHYPYELDELITKEVKNNNYDACLEYFAQFIKHCKQMEKPEHIYHACYLLYVNLQRSMYSWTEGACNLPDAVPYREMLACTSLQQLVKWYEQILFPYLFKTIAELNENKGRQAIEEVKSYLHNNITEVLSLTSVAEQVGLNATYLSRLFKQVTGKSFVQYTASLKIEKSKQLLLNTNRSIAEIAEDVGYTERTFGRVFKNMTGMTPTNYRLQHKQNMKVR